MTLRRTAKPSDGAQREMLCLSQNKSLAVFQLYWNPPSSFIPTETANLRPLSVSPISLVSFRFGASTHPVSIKNHPIPPIHPTRMCRGKNPMMAPRRSFPRMKKVTPVRRDENENATSVVAMTAWGLFSPTILMISIARMLKNGCQGARNRASFFCKNGSEGRDRGRRTTISIIILPIPPEKPLPPNVNTSCEVIVLGCHGSRSEKIQRKGGKYTRNEEEGYTHRTKAIENSHGGEQDHAIRDAIQNVEK